MALLWQQSGFSGFPTEISLDSDNTAVIEYIIIYEIFPTISRHSYSRINTFLTRKGITCSIKSRMSNQIATVDLICCEFVVPLTIIRSVSKV